MTVALSGAPLPLSAQEQQQGQQPLTQQQIEQLVAPIALYPDSLLAQILTASTYPLEVAMAARWSEKNPKLKGAVLEDAMQKQSWDPSVKALTSVPQVLAMMNDKLDWTQQLGEAFLAQPDDVQNAIQELRAKAETAGNLKSSKEQRVRRVPAPSIADYVGPPEYIVIEPIEPDYIYVPVYNPIIVFGVGFWPPAYVPFFWYPPWWTVGPVFGFGPAFFVGPALWCQYNWGYRGLAAIHVNNVFYNRFNKSRFTGEDHWKFDPAHRKEQFKNAKLQQQYGKTIEGGKGIEGRKTIEGGKGIEGRKGVEGGKAIEGRKGIEGRKAEGHKASRSGGSFKASHGGSFKPSHGGSFKPSHGSGFKGGGGGGFKGGGGGGGFKGGGGGGGFKGGGGGGGKGRGKH